jgi:glycosyltransferase involved in cell wall biosynthesis
MLRRALNPRRVLMTVDGVGGVWRYALDLARALQPHGVRFLLAGAGPEPDPAMRRECTDLPNVDLIWTDIPLDWMVADERDLDRVPAALRQAAQTWRPDLLHLNLPSQAAGLCTDIPVVVAAHSCVPTWWAAMRHENLPPGWRWQRERNRQGFARADRVLVPSASHGAAVQRAYGNFAQLSVVHNATISAVSAEPKQPFVLAAGRWWDEAKNAATLDAAAACVPWPVILAGPLHGPNGQCFTGQHAETRGALPAATVRALMHQAAIFAAPSRYEPFGLAVLEAATSGAALILSDIPTFRELWDGAAMFVPPLDPKAWEATIRMLSADAAHRQSLAGQARLRARKFTPERQAEKILQAYARASQAAPALSVA